MRWCVWLAVAVLAGAAAGAETALEVKAAGEKAFYVDGRAGANQMAFTSESTIEDFTGICNQVRGECRLDPRKLESFAGRFSVRVADMRTGTDLRDQHMRGTDWLDAEKHPEIVIAVTAVSDVRKTGANTATLTLVGTCALHGKTRDVRIPATLTYLDESPETQKRVKGDLIRLRAEFGLKLSDYDIRGPRGAETIGLKVADEIGLKVTVFCATDKPPVDPAVDKPTTSGPAVAPPKRPGN